MVRSVEHLHFQFTIEIINPCLSKTISLSVIPPTHLKSLITGQPAGHVVKPKVPGFLARGVRCYKYWLVIADCSNPTPIVCLEGRIHNIHYIVFVTLGESRWLVCHWWPLISSTSSETPDNQLYFGHLTIKNHSNDVLVVSRCQCLSLGMILECCWTRSNYIGFFG